MDKKKKVIVITAASVVLVLLIATIALLYFQMRAQQEENRQMQELAEMDKLEMQNEYEDFAKQYGELQQQINNDSLVAQLALEKERTEALLEELKRTKSDNAAEIMRLKKELATLRAILREYVIQIDSLNHQNERLTNENNDLRNQNAAAQQSISSLTSEKASLSDKVAIAAQLDATGISAIAKNKKGKACQKVKDAKKFQLSFNIARNVTAQAGNRAIYIRITTPTGSILTHGGTFTYENRNLEYSIRKDIEYNGEETAVIVYWDVAEALSAGTYRFDIFADGHNIGSTSISLQ